MDLFKLYGNDLLDRLMKPGVGSHIGEISSIAPTCAGDMLIVSARRDTPQTLLNIAVVYSCREHYLLQPQKSLLLEIMPNLWRQDPEEPDINIKGQPMSIVREKTHMGNKYDLPQMLDL